MWGGRDNHQTTETPTIQSNDFYITTTDSNEYPAVERYWIIDRKKISFLFSILSFQKNALKAHFTRLREEKRGDQKKLKRIAKPYLYSRKNANSSHTIILKDNEQIVWDQLQMCETLNYYPATLS